MQDSDESIFSDYPEGVDKKIMEERSSIFKRVGDLHQKMGYSHFNDGSPRLLPEDEFDFRVRFLREELEEMEQAHLEDDLVGVADAIGDIIIVAMGAAHYAHIPLEEVLHAIMDANMRKVPGTTARGHGNDMVKPPNWRPPEPAITEILNLHYVKKETR